MLKNKFISVKYKYFNNSKFYLQIILVLIVGLIPLCSFSQWTSNTTVNTPVCTSVNDQKDYSIASDTKGGAFIIWNDKRNNILRSDIYAQRINSLGYSMWTAEGIGVCTNAADQANPSTAEDGYGGVIIAWDDSVNGNRDIFAQRLDSNGNSKWIPGGIPVIVKTGKQRNVKIISDGAGGAIAVWEDSTSGYWDIYAQRINSNGVVMWASAGVPVCTNLMNQKNPRLVSDGSGGAFITWQDKRNGIDYDIYVQHLNSSGVALLATDGIAVCTSADKQTDPKIVSDGLGGAIIAWQDKRSGIYYDVYAQRINSAGTIMWFSNGTAVCTADSSQTSIDITSDNIIGAVLTWRDKRNGLYHDIYTQKINLNGSVAWQLNGIPVTTAALTQTSPNICGDGAGGAIIVWQDSTVSDWNIKSQRINSAGVILWNSGGNIVTNAGNVQINPKNISDGKGGCIYVWQDFRNGLNDDVYVQHLFNNGVEGIFNEPVYSFEDVVIFPNPVIISAKIQFPFEKNDINSLFGIIYDIFGREISTFALSKSNPELYVNDMSDGIYFLKIIKNEKTLSFTKFIIKK